MSSPAHEPKGEAWYLLMTAATDEAARAGHGQVDVDHVLLALLVTGGPSTQVLSRAGLRLAAARTALVEVQRADLASLGVDLPVPPPVAGHTYGAGTAALPWSDRARRAVAPMTDGEADTAVLAEVLSDEDGPARRVLAQAGLDTETVLSAALADAGSGAPAAGPAPGSRAWASSHTSTVAVPRAEVWRVVDDPGRRPEWDDDVADVRLLDDHSFETLDALARTLDRPDDPALRSTHRVTERVAGRLVEWETRFPNRGHTEWLRVELEDDGAGSRLTLRHAAGPPRGVLRLFARLSGWTTRMRLKLLAQAIAQTASAD